MPFGFTESCAHGVVVPIPTRWFVARKRLEVAVSVFVPLKYGNCPVVPVYSDEVAIVSESEEPSVVSAPVRPRLSAAVEVALVLSVPFTPYRTPVSEPSTGAFVNVCVPPQVLLVEVPKARLMVFEVFTSGYVNVNAACLLLNVLQSVEERRPRLEADAVGRLNVTVLPEAVMVKSVPVVLEARVTVGPVCVCPAGPMAVTAEVRYVLVSMESVPSPLMVFTNPFVVRFESFEMFWLVFTLNAPAAYVRPVPAVVVEVQVGMPPKSARTWPAVPADVVASEPAPFPYRSAPD